MTDRAHETNHHRSASDTNGSGESAPTGAEAELELGEFVTKVMDIVRYAPIGILLDGPALLPKLAEQGKVHVKNAEWLGGMALQQGRKALERQLHVVGTQAVDFLKMMGVIAEEEEAGSTTRVRPAAQPSRATPSAAESAAALVDSPGVDDLAIPDYDSLSASQVINRLPSLSVEELEAVRAYEAAHRGRKTILNKVVQLQV